MHTAPDLARRRVHGEVSGQGKPPRSAGGEHEGDTATMPKTKTHSGAKKRFRLTGSGKVMRRRAGRAHYNEHKPSWRTRRLKNEVVLSEGDAKKIKKLLRK